MLRTVRDECSYDSGRRLRCKQCKGFVCPSASPVASKGVRAADWGEVYQRAGRRSRGKIRLRAGNFSEWNEEEAGRRSRGDDGSPTECTERLPKI